MMKNNCLLSVAMMLDKQVYLIPRDLMGSQHGMMKMMLRSGGAVSWNT